MNPDMFHKKYIAYKEGIDNSLMYRQMRQFIEEIVTEHTNRWENIKMNCFRKINKLTIMNNTLLRNVNDDNKHITIAPCISEMIKVIEGYDVFMNDLAQYYVQRYDMLNKRTNIAAYKRIKELQKSFPKTSLRKPIPLSVTARVGHPTKDQIRKCPYCPKRFAKNTANYTVVEHIKFVHGKDPYVCKYCNQSFTKTRFLETHSLKCRKRLTNIMENVEAIEPPRKKIKHQLYCICRKPETGDMIMCDGCSIWFHSECIHMDPIMIRYWPKEKIWRCIKCQYKHGNFKFAYLLQLNIYTLKLLNTLLTSPHKCNLVRLQQKIAADQTTSINSKMSSPVQKILYKIIHICNNNHQIKKFVKSIIEDPILLSDSRVCGKVCEWIQKTD